MDTIKAWFARVFMKDWKTSLYGLVAIFCQAAPYLTSYLGTLDVPQKYLNLITFAAGIMFVLESKDGSNVSIQPTS
jgi:hypothetical protein